MYEREISYRISSWHPITNCSCCSEYFFLLSYFVGPTIGLQILSSLIPLYYFLMFRISQQIVFKFTAGLWLLTSQDQHVNSIFFFSQPNFSFLNVILIAQTIALQNTIESVYYNNHHCLILLTDVW